MEEELLNKILMKVVSMEQRMDTIATKDDLAALHDRLEERLEFVEQKLGIPAS